MTIAAVPRHKASFLAHSGSSRNRTGFSKPVTRQDPKPPFNGTLAGNITVELTVRMDGKKIGNVEMSKSYYEKVDNASTSPPLNSSLPSPLPKPYEVVIYNDDLPNSDSSSGEKNTENDAAHQNVTGSEKPLSTSKSNRTNGDLEKEKEWSDTNLEDRNKTSNPIFNELLELDPGLLSQNIFDEEASGWDDVLPFNVTHRQQGNSSNLTSVILLPDSLQPNSSSNLFEPEDSVIFNNIKGLTTPDDESLLRKVLKLKDAGALYSRTSRPTNSPENLHGDNDTAVSNSTNEINPRDDVVLRKLLDLKDATNLYSRSSRPMEEQDKHDIVNTLTELFRLLITNRTLQNIQHSYLYTGSGTLRERYYTDVVNLLKLLKRTLNQLEMPQDNGTEDVLYNTLKELMRMITLMDASLESLSQPEDKEDESASSSRSLSANSTFSNALKYQRIIAPLLSSNFTTPTTKAYGDLGDVKNNTETQKRKHEISVDELMQLLQLL